MAYAITTGNSMQFGTIDLNTGTFSPISNESLNLAGLGVVNGKLYSAASGTLYLVNVANGSLTKVGASSTTYGVFGSTLTGLYTVAAGYLYSIDPGTGAVTQIGTGVVPQACSYGQLSTNSATLYYSCGLNLYTIDPSSATPTLVGRNSVDLLTALTSINGTLYGGNLGDFAATGIYSVNPANAVLTKVASLKGTSGYPSGFAPIVKAPAPTINPGGTVPIYSSSTTIQPGSWISIYGTNFAGANSLWAGDFPTSLGDVTVTIDNKLAYLWLVTPGQINLEAPDDTATGTVNVTVTNAAGSASSTVTLDRYGPSFSLFGNKYAAAIVPTAGSGNSGSGYDFIGPTSAFSFTTRPVKAGETVQLYGVGFGPTTTSVPAGKAFLGAVPSVTYPQVTIGGQPATVTFAGIIETGLYQLNVVVPNAGSGDQALQASLGGLTTPQGVFITLQ